MFEKSISSTASKSLMPDVARVEIPSAEAINFSFELLDIERLEIFVKTPVPIISNVAKLPSPPSKT